MPSRGSRALLWLAVALVSPILLCALYLTLFAWNWLRSPLEHLALQKTGRVLSIQGDLTLKLGWPTVRLQAAQLSFANPAWAKAPQMVEATNVAVRVDVPALLRHRLVFPQVSLDQAHVVLEQAADARKSWLLDLEQQDEEARAQIGRVELNRGTLRYDDASQFTHLHIDLAAAQLANASTGTTDLHFSAAGLYKGLSVKATGSGGPVLALRDATLPYPLTLDGSMGKTGVHLQGSVTGLLTFTALDMHMALHGDNLEQLYPLLGIAFPATHSYVTQGHLMHTGNTWRYEDFTGRVGTSDVAGFVQVITGGKRPTLTADLRCELLNLDDLGPLIGTHADNRVAMAPSRSPPQRVLPDEPFEVGHWDTVNAAVDLHAHKLRRSNLLPLNGLEAHLHLLDSVLTLDPLNLGLAGGLLSARITLDGRRPPIQAHAQVRARNVQLAQLLPRVDLSKSSIGSLNGEFDLTGGGNSVGQMLASANGKLGLVVAGGQISKLMMEQAGLHLWEVLSLSLTGDRLVKLRCAVANFEVKHGQMQAQALVLDTQVTTLIGTGSIDLAQEQLDLTLNPKTKNTSPVAFRSPIYLRGNFAHPTVQIDKLRVTARAVSAVVLGAVNPLLALIPLIDAGPGQDSDCAQLVRDARAWPRAKATAPLRQP
jgi:AsmA protein